MHPWIVAVALAVLLLWWWILPLSVIIAGGVATVWIYFRFLKRQHDATEEDAREAVRIEYDYIIVGGGAAGCLLANRLTEDKKKQKRVLVLEAGHPYYDRLKFRIPAATYDQWKTESDWDMSTSNEPALTREGGVHLSRGKMLGGSTALSTMIYNRGDANDYEAWERDFGCKDWNAKSVLPFFRRSHYDQTCTYIKDAKHHGRIGEWFVDHVRYHNVLSKCFLNACNSLGLRSNEDFNTWLRPQEGFGRFTFSLNDGERVSAASAFLAPAQADGSRRLVVLAGARAEQIIFNRERSAIGVKFKAGGCKHLARINLESGGEILLTAGALHSPQLLMVSGVGPAAQLTKQGISVVYDVPGVGENLQDQPYAHVSFECRRGCSLAPPFLAFAGWKVLHPFHFLDWLRKRTGRLTSPGPDHGGFYNTAAASDGAQSPDLQVIFLPVRADTAESGDPLAICKGIAKALDGLTFQCIAARPYSRGHIRLNGPSIYDSPAIQGGYCVDKRDLGTLREGIRLARKIAHQPAFKDFVGSEVLPGLTTQTDEQLDEFILNNLHSANALVGTCRMGPLGSGAVCDTALRVRGIKNVRVCDASVMPKLPGGQAGAATLMIAERAAEFLLNPPERVAEGPEWPPLPKPPMDIPIERIPIEQLAAELVHTDR